MTPNTSTAVGPDPVAPTPSQLRRAMGAFATGVTIISGMDGEEPVGFACQTFASVSLTPPLVLFCADHRGRSWPRIARSGRFNVSVLSDSHRDLCARFGSSTGAKFDGLPWQRSRWGTPIFAEVLLRVHCRVEVVHVAGDHDVVIGRVEELEAPDTTARPMIFYKGQFGVDVDQHTPAPSVWGWGDRWG